MSQPLHLVHSQAALARCLTRRSEKDRVLLLGDAVYATTDADTLVLADDANARGIQTTPDRLVSYADFVALASACQPIVTWR